MASEVLTNFQQIKRLYISILCASIAYYVFITSLSVFVHFHEGNMEAYILLLVLGLVLRLMAMYGAIKEMYGLSIAFALIMSFFTIVTFLGLTGGGVHPMNVVALLLHSATTLFAFLFAYKIREKHLQKLATVVFCSSSVPSLINNSGGTNRAAYYSSCSLTAPVQVSIVEQFDRHMDRHPPKYEEVINCSKQLNTDIVSHQRV